MPIAPGKVTKVTIDCWAMGQRLDAGDRMRLLASTAWPGYARNLNTLAAHGSAREAVIANNTIYHDRERPSPVLLPVVPRDGAPGLTFER